MNGHLADPITHHNPTPGLLTAEFTKSCVNFFFDNLYTKLPILDRSTIESQMMCLERSPETYCLFTALTAFMMLQPGMGFPTADYQLQMEVGSNIAASGILLDECLRVRKGMDYWINPNLNILATNYFIYAVHYAQDSHANAWYYLREATTMIQMSGMNNSDSFVQDIDSIRRRRLFWLFFNAERAYALHRGYPLTLQPTLHPGNFTDDPTDNFNPGLQSNFFNLCGVFQTVNDSFLTAWREGCCRLDAQSITSLNTSLQKMQHSYPPSASYQAVQNWIKNLQWQVSGEAQESAAYQRMTQILSGFPPNSVPPLMNSGLVRA